MRATAQGRGDISRQSYNERQIAAYLENFDLIHRSAAGSEVPAGREAKGMRQYVAPISEKGFSYLDDVGNREAATLLSPILARMRRERFDLYYSAGLVAGWYVPQPKSLTREQVDERQRERDARTAREEEQRKRRGGFVRRTKVKKDKEGEEPSTAEHSDEPPPVSVPGAEEPDHGILRRWKAGADQGYQDDEDALAQFNAACRWLAERLPKDTELDVYAPGGRQAKTPRQAAAKDRQEGERASMARSHRIRYRQFRQVLIEYPDATREAAKAIWSERHHMSVGTLERAIRFCETHVWPKPGGDFGGEPVAPRHRWREEMMKEGAA